MLRISTFLLEVSSAVHTHYTIEDFMVGVNQVDNLQPFFHHGTYHSL